MVAAGDRDGLGFGEAVGKAIAESNVPHKDISIFAAAYQAGVPATVHVGVGYDIIHEHPNYDGAAAGAASYRDFLIFAKAVENLEGGVVMRFGQPSWGRKFTSRPCRWPATSQPAKNGESAISPRLSSTCSTFPATCTRKPLRTSTNITTAPTRPSLSALYPTAGGAFTSAATTSPHCPRYMAY